MNLISDELRAQLLANGRQSLADEDFDPPPVVKLFTPDAGATWLLTDRRRRPCIRTVRPGSRLS